MLHRVIAVVPIVVQDVWNHHVEYMMMNEYTLGAFLFYIFLEVETGFFYFSKVSIVYCFVVLSQRVFLACNDVFQFYAWNLGAFPSLLHVVSPHAKREKVFQF